MGMEIPGVSSARGTSTAVGTATVDDQKPARRRGHRRRKGNRVQTSVSLEAEIHEQVLALAERDSQPITDVISRLCAEALGLPVPDYCVPKPKVQGELPLAQAS